MIVNLFSLYFAVEHALAHINILKWAGCCQRDTLQMLKQYFINVHSQLFSFIPYNMPLAFINVFLNVTSTFTWNFIDLFIMLLSLSLVERFKLFNSYLKSFKGKVSLKKISSIPLWWVWHSEQFLLLRTLYPAMFWELN